MDISGEKRTFSTLKPEEPVEQPQLDSPSLATNKRLKPEPPSVSRILSGAATKLSSADGSTAAAAAVAKAAVAAATPATVASSTASSSLATTPLVFDLTQDDEEEDSLIKVSASAAATSAAAAASPTGGARKSSREKKSTLVYIDGYAVKRDNNYVVRGGEYVHGAYTANGTATDGGSLARLPRPTQKLAAKKPAVRKPRVISKAEKLRTAHNDVVKKRAASKQKARNSFLAKHAKTLEPFLDDKVNAFLSSIPSGKTDQFKDLSMQPDMLEGDMRDYQLDGLNFMAKMHASNLPCILGDEMGLGKTLQTISLLCHIKEHEQASGPSLVICPLSVLYSWCTEIEKWAPGLKFLRLHSSCVDEREVQRKAFVEKATTYDVVVTTYEMAKAPSLSSLWKRMYFNYLVLDEGHKIKNHESLIAQGVRHIHCESKLILTGTPLQNNLIELWSLLNFLYPDIFTTSQPFADAFDIVHNEVDKEKLTMAHDLLDLFMIRRMKNEVEKLMPPKIETKVICPLSTTQIFWYKALLMKDLNLLARMADKAAAEGDDNKKGAIGTTGKSQISNLIMQLRKCCLHPYLFEGAELDINATTVEDLVAASGKLAVLDKLLRSLFLKGHRTVLFSQFTSVLDILEDYCNMRGWKYCRFDGGTPRARRNYIVNQFNAPDSESFVFLMSTRSGGMGLNLQTADTCILFDSDWNPQPDLQAMARVHRIGQKKTVHVYRLVSGGTIEERIVERAQKKLYLDKIVNSSSSDSEKKDTGVSGSDLLKSLQFGCNAVFGDGSANLLPTEDDIDTITDRSRTEESSAGKLKGGAAETTEDFNAEFDLTETQTFGGVDFRALRDKQKKEKGSIIPSNIRDVAVNWAKANGKGKEEKRDRKSRLVMLQGKGSGYGKAFVPILASNNYELEKGESSVFASELKGRGGDYKVHKKKKKAVEFENQDFCQVCGDGGELICCPKCPVAMHAHCAGIRSAKDLMHCSHHNCTECGKNCSSAGGILFPCQSCPRSFCEDCLPSTKGLRLLGRCERFEKLGYKTTHQTAYIHCSAQCEKVALQEFGWTPPRRSKRECPAEMDVSHNFATTKIDGKE